MKKTYQMPTTKVVKMQTVQMIAVSLYGKDAESAAMSREGGSFWDEDEE